MKWWHYLAVSGVSLWHIYLFLLKLGIIRPKRMEAKMAPDITSGNLGPETTFDVAFSGGALNVTLKYAGAQASAAFTGTVSASQLINALATKVTNAAEKEVLTALAGIIAAIP